MVFKLPQFLFFAGPQDAKSVFKEQWIEAYPFPRANAKASLYTRNARSLPHLCSTSGSLG